ncbi:MAG: signal recognition particle protein, partial [Rhodospirillales bacterium]|nr:signal recognition particle protein [Rhodospirillales bacterium]
MFDGLSDRLSGIFEGLKKRGALKEVDVEAALREIRVALPVVKDFIDGVRVRAIGEE